MSDVRFLLFVPETVEHMGRATPNEVRQLLANAHVTTDNPAMVIEATLDPTTWLPGHRLGLRSSRV